MQQKLNDVDGVFYFLFFLSVLNLVRIIGPVKSSKSYPVFLHAFWNSFTHNHAWTNFSISQQYYLKNHRKTVVCFKKKSFPVECKSSVAFHFKSRETRKNNQ